VTEWLRAPDPSSNHNRAQQSRHEGTGSWLLADARYQAWKTEPASFLWLSGILGCGKTVLSSTLIDDIRDACPPACLAYFYFDFDDPMKRSLDNLLRALCRQLYAKSDATKNCVRALWESCDRGHRQPMTSQLYECLVEVLTRSDRLWIVLDALDESTTREGSHVEGILPFIEQLMQACRGDTHLLVTSRAEQDIEDSFFKWAPRDSRIALQSSLIDHDIESYIDHQLRSSGRFDRWQNRVDLLQRIKATLMAQVDGM
jgi:hypothetical protein